MGQLMAFRIAEPVHGMRDHAQVLELVLILVAANSAGQIN
jgi:hypothetical protein